MINHNFTNFLNQRIVDLLIFLNEHSDVKIIYDLCI